MKFLHTLFCLVFLLPICLFSQIRECNGMEPQQALTDVATPYASDSEDFMMELAGETTVFQMLDFFNPDASYFASSLKNVEPDKITYSWLSEIGHLSINQTAAGLFSTPIDRSFNHGKVWQLFVNVIPKVESENSYSGVYFKSHISGENFDRYIILLGNKKSSTFWFGEYNTSTKMYTSYIDVENSDCNYVTHPSVKLYGSVDYSVYRNNDYLFLRLNSSFLFNFYINSNLTAFDYIVETGVITFNAQETEVSHVQWNNFSSMSGVSLEQYEQNQSTNNNIGVQPVDDGEYSGDLPVFYGTYLIYYGEGNFVHVTHAYEVYANTYPSESELTKLKNDKIYYDAPDTESYIGSDFIPDYTCDEALEMLKDMYIESGLENYSTDYCLDDYEIDN